MTHFFHPIEILKEKLFHVSELNKLHRMKESVDKREMKAHKDFLSESSKEKVRAHNSQIEHYATQFWNHYYFGERPYSILKNRPISIHEYGECDPCATMKELMVKPEFTALIPQLDGNGEPILKSICDSQNKWVNLMWLAGIDYKSGNLAEAERGYREALEQTRMFDDSDLHKSKAFLGLATCLFEQGRVEQAEEIFSLLADVDSSLISADRRDLEDDFVTLAEHFLLVGENDKAESLYLKVLARWRELLAPSDPLLARCLNGLGIIYGCENRWQLAEQSFKEAVEIFEQQKIPRKAELASVIENLANLYAINNEQEKAALLYSRALMLHEEDRKGAIQCKNGGAAAAESKFDQQQRCRTRLR